MENENLFKNPSKVELITFGAPAVGNDKFVERFHARTKAMSGALLPYCFTNKLDIVPHSPRSLLHQQLTPGMDKILLVMKMSCIPMKLLY
jgi:predicted lipase